MCNNIKTQQKKKYKHNKQKKNINMGLLLHTEPENGTSSDESQSEDLSYVFVPRTMIKPINHGRIATNPKNNAPGNVILRKTRVKYF